MAPWEKAILGTAYRPWKSGPDELTLHVLEGPHGYILDPEDMEALESCL